MEAVAEGVAGTGVLPAGEAQEHNKVRNRVRTKKRVENGVVSFWDSGLRT
jgi:hypothetical protein